MAGGSADEGASVLETPPLVLALVFSFFLVVTLGTDWVSFVGIGGEEPLLSDDAVRVYCLPSLSWGEGRPTQLPSATDHQPSTTPFLDPAPLPPLPEKEGQAGPAGRPRYDGAGAHVAGCGDAPTSGGREKRGGDVR